VFETIDNKSFQELMPRARTGADHRQLPPFKTALMVLSHEAALIAAPQGTPTRLQRVFFILFLPTLRLSHSSRFSFYFILL
jgi:hypothetical protein